MKKLFFFAAAMLAAVSMNAKVISFAGIVDGTSAETAKNSLESAYNLTNISITGAESSDGSFYAEIYQSTGVPVTDPLDWSKTKAVLKSDAQVYFQFTDKADDKLVMKAYSSYIQPNGKAVRMVITGVNVGDEIKLNLNKVLNKATLVEGATASDANFNAKLITLTASANTVYVYSRSDAAGTAEAKWQLVSVEVPGETALGEAEAEGAKAVKKMVNGQLVIEKGGKLYNALGAEL